MNVSRRRTLRTIGTLSTVGVAGCIGNPDPSNDSGENHSTSTTSGSGANEAAVRAAFVYHDSVGDFGWQWAHDQGRRAIDAEYDWLETEFYDNIAHTGSKPRFAQVAERGFDVIYGTSFGYMDPMYAVAPDYPDVVFENCSGYKERENLGRYFGRMYQPRYLTGVAAGLLTETNDIGYVAAFPISEVIRGINAFALGAASVNENATVQVKYTDTWNDAGVERTTATQLIEEGVDVMAQHQNYPAAADTASKAGIWATGYNSSMSEYVGENYVTSPIWNWEVFYRQSVETVFNDTWTADFYWMGLNSGIVDLSEWGPKVPNIVKETVATRRDEIERDERDVWAGSKFTDYDDKELFRSVSSYVDNVTGKEPD